MKLANPVGVAGTIGVPKYGALFQCWVFAVDRNLEGTLIDAAGRGDAEMPEERVAGVRGMFLCTSWIDEATYFMPNNFQGEHGTLTLEYHNGAKETLLIEITGHRVQRNEKTENKFMITIGCRLRAVPVQSGFRGTQPTSSAPSHADKYLYGQMSKQLEVNGIDETASERVLIWGLADTNSAEAGAIAGYIGAAVPPIADMKQRPFTLTRANFRATYVNLNWSRVDTKDELEMAGEESTDSIDDFNETAVLRRVTDSATPPATPPAPHGQILGCTSTPVRRANGSYTGRWVHEFNYGPSTPTQLAEFADASFTVDPAALDDGQIIPIVNSTFAPPATPTPDNADLVLFRRRTMRRQGTPAKWIHIFEFAYNTSVQNLESEQTTATTDPNHLRDSEAIGIVFDTGSPPADPTPTIDADLKVIDYRDINTNNPALMLRVFRFGRIDSKDQIELEGEHSLNASDDVDETAVLRRVTNSATPPATPAAPRGQILEIDTEPETRANGSYTGMWVHIYRYGPSTKSQVWQFEDSQLTVDPVALDDGEVIAIVSGSSTAPATPSPVNPDLTLRRRRTRQKQGTPQKWIHIFEFTFRTSAGELEAAETRASIDASDLQSEYFLAEVFDAGSPPSPPGADSGFVYVDYRDRETNDPDFKLRVWHFGKRTSQQAWEEDNSFDFEDPNAIGSRQAIAQVDSVPTAPSGFKSRGVRSKLLTPDHTGYVLESGLRDTLDDEQMPGTFAEADIEGRRAILTEETLILECDESDTDATLLAALISTLSGGSAPWMNARIQKIDDTHYRQVIVRPSDDKKFTIRASGGSWEERMLDAGGTMVRLGEIYQVAFSHYRITLEPWRIFVTRETVVLRRYYQASNFASQTYDGFRGTRNSDAFGDIAAGTAAFIGANVVYSFADDGGTHWLAVDFVFERAIARDSSAPVDALWTTVGIPRGWVTITGVVIASYTPLGSALNALWVPVVLDSVTYSSVFLA